MSQYLRSKSKNEGAESSKNPAGSRQSMSSVPTSDGSTRDRGKGKWIASQRDSLVRIFRVLAQVQESEASEADSSGGCFEQLTLFDRQSSFSKTRRKSEQKAGGKSSRLLWREDIPGETERLPPLMSAQAISAIAGGALLPTLTVSGNWNKKGASQNSGDGLGTALRRLPTLLATDGDHGKMLPTLTKSDGSGGPGHSKKRTGGLNLRTALSELLSSKDFPVSTQKRLQSPERIQGQSVGHRLTPAFAEWWMGWPIEWTALKPAETDKCRSKRR